MKSTLTIKFSPGDSIEDAFEESIRIARILWVLVEFDFNGVKCWGHPNGNAQTGVINYDKAMKGITNYKYAHSI